MLKNEPNSIVSEAMKRYMPSRRASTRELLCAAGGWPWSCSWAWATEAMARNAASASAAPRRRTCLTGSPAPLSIRPTTSRRSQPEVASGKRRDDDLVDLLVVDGVERGGDGVGVADVPGRLDPLPLELGERLVEPAAARPAGRPGATSVKSAGPALRALADRLEERPADDRLVGDHEHVDALARRGQVDLDVRHGDVLGRLLRPVDQPAAQPARPHGARDGSR